MSKTKYHVNPETGRTGKCTGTVRGCKFAENGEIPEHYDTEAQARNDYERLMQDVTLPDNFTLTERKAIKYNTPRENTVYSKRDVIGLKFSKTDYVREVKNVNDTVFKETYGLSNIPVSGMDDETPAMKSFYKKAEKYENAYLTGDKNNTTSYSDVMNSFNDRDEVFIVTDKKDFTDEALKTYFEKNNIQNTPELRESLSEIGFYDSKNYSPVIETVGRWEDAHVKITGYDVSQNLKRDLTDVLVMNNIIEKEHVKSNQ